MTESELYGQGTFRERVEKRGSFGPSIAEIRKRIVNFVGDLATMMDKACGHPRELGQNEVSWTFEVEVKEEGPAYNVICVVRLVRDLSMQNQLPALQPIA